MGFEDNRPGRDLGQFASVDAADSENFVTRLDEMQALDSFKLYKRRAIELMRLMPGAAVADIGCGTGDDARRLVSLIGPGGRVTGFDVSETMLAQARSRHGAVEGLDFKLVQGETLPIEDAIFDAVRADRVLIHVPDPRTTLREMVRIAKPGAPIVVSEPDMPGCWMSSDEPLLATRLVGAIAGSCVSPYLARDLLALFKDAGLADLALTVSPVTVLDPAAVSTILDFTSVVNGMVSKGFLTAERAQTWLAELAERGRTGRFAAGLSIMTVVGTKL